MFVTTGTNKVIFNQKAQNKESVDFQVALATSGFGWWTSNWYDKCKEKLRFCICRDSIWQVNPAEIKQAAAEIKLSLRANQKGPHQTHPPQFSNVSCVEQICLWFEHQYYSWCSFYQKNSGDNVISSCHQEKGWCALSWISTRFLVGFLPGISVARYTNLSWRPFSDK